MLDTLRRWPVIVLVVLVAVALALLLWPTERVPPTEAAALDEAPAAEAEGFQAGKAGFTVQVKDVIIPYRVFAVFAMPGEALEIEAVLTEGVGSVEAEAEGGALEPTGRETWRWTAPQQPGLYPVTIVDRGGDVTDQIRLNVFVKQPYDHDGSIGGYRIGRYEAEPLHGNPVYDRPNGFVRVTPENRDAAVSPHFTLGQFLCKQESDWPKYVLVRERLLLKLEMILEEINDLGPETQTLHVMSAFRTPFYNKQIGNRTRYSRHLYGGAADVFVDRDGDTYMDDLTGDGQVTVADARAMAAIVEAQTDETWYRPLVGGLGVYDVAPHRGPFIHVDVRGEPARW